MGWSRKYLNNTSSPVSATITSTTEFTGYQGSVSIAAYDALVSANDVPELDVLAGRQTLVKYLNGQKVYYPGPTGYKGSITVTPGYTGSVGYTGSAA